jgi:hypothetical protein
MRKFYGIALLATLVLPLPIAAQHSTAEAGYYPNGYFGDMWTGIVSSVAPTTKGLSLVYTHQGRTEFFKGVLAESCRVQVGGDKEKKQIVASGIFVGARLRVYYLPKQTSNHMGKGPFPYKAFGNNLLATPPDTPRFNLIFLVELLPEEGQSRTGTVASRNDSTREITLSVTDGTKTADFVGVLVEDYQVRMKDGSFHNLVVSEIPVGTKMTVHYFDEMTGLDRKSGEIHRIYRLRLLDLAQTP